MEGKSKKLWRRNVGICQLMAVFEGTIPKTSDDWPKNQGCAKDWKRMSKVNTLKVGGVWIYQSKLTIWSSLKGQQSLLMPQRIVIRSSRLGHNLLKKVNPEQVSPQTQLILFKKQNKNPQVLRNYSSGPVHYILASVHAHVRYIKHGIKLFHWAG